MIPWGNRIGVLGVNDVVVLVTDIDIVWAFKKRPAS